MTEAVQGGAVETLLIGEESLRDPAVMTVLDQARAGRGKVLIVREEGEAGRRLHGLGDSGRCPVRLGPTGPRTPSARTRRGSPGPASRSSSNRRLRSFIANAERFARR